MASPHTLISIEKKDPLLTIFVLLIISYSTLYAQPDPSRNRLSLDGKWEIIFDHSDEGKDAGWYLDNIFDKNTDKREIIIPSCWEEIEKDYEGVAFYRHKFTIPESWDGQIIELQFDAVNYIAEVWLNNQPVGFHEGGFTPFRFRIENLVSPGKINSLILRVVGPVLLSNKRIDGIGRMETPQWRGAITGGIWQSVSLKASGGFIIDDVYIEPSISHKNVILHISVNNTGYSKEYLKCRSSIFSATGDKVISRDEIVKLNPGINTFSSQLDIPDPQLWSPGSPYLYKAKVDVFLDSVLSDTFTARFGMREFTIRNKKFYLNGDPIYLKGAFFEGLYPAKLAYPDSREMAIREIELAKSAGFNMIRPWRKPPPPMWLDICDEIGILTVGSLAVECMDFPISTPYLPWRVENELRQTILRDRNRTSVVLWELFNEITVRQPILKQMLRPMALLARDLDKTRLILDESGGWAGGANMYLPYQSDPVRINDIHYYPGSQINEDVFANFLSIAKSEDEIEMMGIQKNRIRIGKNVVPGLMTFVSEVGYGSLPDLVENNALFSRFGNPIVPASRYHTKLEYEISDALRKTGFDKVFPDLGQFCLEQQKMHGIANKRMIEAVRSNDEVGGYCVHALSDGDWILGAGLLDLWRNPKTDAYEMTREANQPRIVSIRVLPRNVYSEKGTRLQITGINDLTVLKVNMSVQVISQNGKKVLSENAVIDLENGVSELFNDWLNTSKMKGTYFVKVTLKDSEGKLISANECEFDVFNQEKKITSDVKIAVYDPLNSITSEIKKANINYLAFDQNLETIKTVVIGKLLLQDETTRQQVNQIMEFVEKGGTAIFLDVPGSSIPANNRNIEEIDTDGLPFSVKFKNTRGLWEGNPHIVTSHPVFDGLPTECIMSGLYENIHPVKSMMKQKGTYIAGVISYDWYPEMNINKRHYIGPGDVWWAADVLTTPYGKGTLLLSTLKLIENLGKDPVADRIFLNMIEFGHRNGNTD